MDLAELRFKVDTTELQKADKAIADLAVSVGKLNKVSDDAAKMAAKLEAADAKKAKELAKVAVEAEKVNQARARTAKVEAEAAAASEKSAQAAAKTAAESAKAEAAVLRAEKAKRAEAEATRQAVSIQQRQNDILEFMQQGYTRGQSSILAYAKAAGEATGEIAKILDLQRQLIGGDPFDKSLSGIKALKNELSMLTEVQNLYNQGANLTTKQVRELARDEERLLQVMKQRGATDDQIEQATKDLKKEYMQLANQVNAVVDQEKAMLKARKDAAAGSKYIADTDARLAAALDATNDSLDRRATDTMVKYRAALIATGISSDQVAVKMDNLKNKLDAVAAKEREQQLRYLARAISVQMGDVAISLASGMNPLLVMIQQGDQIRGAIEQTGAKGQELTKAMSEGAATIARGFTNTAYAIGTFVEGAVTALGKTFYESIEVSAVGAVELLVNRLNGVETPLTRLMEIQTAGMRGIVATLGVATAALAGFAVIIYQQTKVETELSRAMAMTGAAMGISTETAKEYAKANADVAGSTAKALEVITQMAKVSNLTKDDIETVMLAAINLQEYGGKAIEDTVKQYSELKKDPVKALLEVMEATGRVDEATIRNVRSLIQQGKQTEAVGLAMQALAKDHKAAVDQMIRNQSPWEASWKAIKEQVSGVWNEIVNLATSQAVMKTFIGLWTIVATIVNTVWMGVKQLFTFLSGTTKLAFALMTGQAQQSYSIVNETWESIKETGQDLIQTQLKINGTMDTATKAVEELRTEEKRLAEERAANQKKANALKEEFKKEDKDPNKEPKSASGNLPTPKSNEIAEIEKRFNSELNLVKKLEADKRKIIKASFDAGLIDRGEFVSRDVEILEDSEREQLGIIKKFDSEIRRVYTENYIKLVQAKAKVLADNRGLKDEAEKEKEVIRDFNDQVQRLDEQATTAAARVKDMGDAIVSANNAAREVRIAEFAKATFENQKAYIAFTNTLRDTNKERELELSLQQSLVGVSEVTAAGLKAQYEEMKRLAPEIRKFNEEMLKAKRDFESVASRAGIQETDKEYQEALKRYQDAMYIADKVIADARVQVNKAATTAIALEYQKQFQRIADTISDSIATALLEGGKNGSKKIRDMLMAELKKPLVVMVQAIVNPIMGSVMGAFGFGSPNNTTSGGGFSLGSAASAVSTGKSLMDVVTMGYTSAITSQMNKVIFSDVGKMLGLSATPVGTVVGATGTTGITATASGSLGSLGTTASGVGGIKATASGSLESLGKTTSGVDGGIQATAGGTTEITKLGATVSKVGVSLVTGYISNKIRAGISGGYKLSGAGETILDIANIAAGFADPITQLVVGAISGLVSRAFGRKLTEVGVKGTFGGAEGFQGQQYTFEKGGWFRSNKEGTSNLDPEVQQGLADQFNTIRASMLTMAAGLGVGSDAILNFTRDIRVNLKGLSEDEALKKLEEEFLAVQEELAGVVLGTTEYARANEKNLDTLNRLHEALGVVNSTFDNLGFKLFELSLENANAAQSFIDLFGTIDKFREATAKYYDNFYTEQEKLSNLLRQLTVAFGNLGIQLPRTKEGFREVADAAKDAGDDRTFAAILGLQDSFLAMIGLVEGQVDEAAKSGATSYADYQIRKAAMVSAAIPQYANGGSYSGGMALVGEKGPELINFSQPGHIYDSAETATILSSGNGGLVAELQNLRQEVVLLRAEVRADVSHNAKTARLLDRVIPDGDSIQIVTAPA